MIGWTLGRYFFMRYAKITLWLFFGTMALIFLITFTEFSNRTNGLPGFSIQLAMAIAALRTPMVVQQSVPFIGLFAAMATLVSLNRKYELVVARSAGVSAWQFLTPPCIGAILFGLAAVTLLNPLAAGTFTLADRMETELRSGVSNEVTAAGAPWLRQRTADGDAIIGARAVLDQGLRMADAKFFLLEPNGDIRERLDAQSADLRPGYWELTNVTVSREGALPETVPTMQVKTNLQPEFVQERLARPETIPFFSLPAKIAVARSFGLGADAFAMQYYSLVALPALLVAMTLIASSVSLRFTRLGQSTGLILGGILAGFLLYVVTALVMAFGSAGFVPPVIAAWVPVIVGMFFGVSFLLHREDG